MNLDARRPERDEEAIEEVVQRIYDELVRHGYDALKLPIDAFVSSIGSLDRLRRAARLAGARYGWAKTRTTRVVDDSGVEWLVMCDSGPSLRIVGQIDSRLNKVIASLAPDISPTDA